VRQSGYVGKYLVTDQGSLVEDSLDSLLDGLVAMQTAWEFKTQHLLADWQEGVGEE
jgi:hypothetical protein